MHPAVAKALDKAASALSDAGYAVEDIEPPFAQETGEVGYRTLLSEVRDLLGSDIRRYGSTEINAIFDEYYRKFPPYERVAFLQMLAKRTYYARQWALFLEDYPLVLTPFLLFALVVHHEFPWFASWQPANAYRKYGRRPYPHRRSDCRAQMARRSDR